ncbi:hypothetical protein CJ030_MR4G010924 [Morella rubra]|uniref:Uncharacterized protein n=1 Tax=Morella rubra TaxID=262757 RepID=A0A6A1VSB7_9ROSI|nr:hypothetical protein CJ030_MR4G010924 [Morella rubra]
MNTSPLNPTDLEADIASLIGKTQSFNCEDDSISYEDKMEDADRISQKVLVGDWIEEPPMESGVFCFPVLLSNIALGPLRTTQRLFWIPLGIPIRVLNHSVSNHSGFGLLLVVRLSSNLGSLLFKVLQLSYSIRKLEHSS